jgi:phosphoglycolate phosphatase
MKKYKLAVFDMDGTILDTLSDLHLSVNYILKEAGFPERTLEEVRRFVGNGIRKLIERAVPDGTDDEKIEELFQNMLVYYNAHCTEHTAPYEGIPELIDELKAGGIKVAVVSNKANTAVQTLCEQYFPGQFMAAVGEKKGVRRKPAPDSVNAVLEELGVDRKDAVYIGDSDVDVNTAKNAEMDCIGVDWGFRGEEFLRSFGCDNVVFKPSEIAEQLL